MVQLLNLPVGGTSEEYAFSLGSSGLKGIAKLVIDEECCIKACRTIEEHCALYKVVGFDAEWRPSFIKGVNNPVALLQIATPLSGIVYLFRLNLLRRVPTCLKALLEDKTLIKVGVSPKIDSDKMQADYNVSVRGTLDLRLLYNTTEGLSGLTKQILKVGLNKDIALSNWEQDKLSLDQILYAAKDAFTAVEIFKQWPGIKFNGNRVPWNDALIQIAKFIDEPFKANAEKWKHCVVCGTSDNVVVKKNIFPKCFKKYCPEDLKVVRDIQPLCMSCEMKSGLYILPLNHALQYVNCELLGIPFFSKRSIKRGALDRIRESKIMSNFLEEGLKWKKLDPPMLEPLGLVIIELYKTNDVSLSKLQQLWREMFVEAMAPQFLPSDWMIE